MTEMSRIKAVKEKYEALLMQIEGVVGVGIGKSAKNAMCVKVYVKEKRPELEHLVPKSLEDISVEVREVGEVVAYS